MFGEFFSFFPFFLPLFCFEGGDEGDDDGSADFCWGIIVIRGLRLCRRIALRICIGR